jgi:hypothetical protein
MHQRLVDWLERLGKLMAHDLRIGFVGDDHELAVDEAVRSGRIARAARRHRRQLENVLFAHDGSWFWS